MLHGSGVVCGLELKGKKGKRSIQITPGLALDCSGNEIWVPKDLKIDLSSLLPPKNKPKGEPDCRPVDEEDKLKTYYIGIRYDEKPTNPVSVYLPSGDCEERTCENSRWKEGYCVEIVECCYEDEKPGLLADLCQCEDDPSLEKYRDKYTDLCGKCGKGPNDTKDPAYSKQDPQQRKDWCECMVLEEFCERSIPCSECCSCDQPCHVILGQIKIDPENCVLETLCMNECRRYVLTGRLVQQVLLRIFSGTENRLEVKVGTETIKLQDDEKFSDFIYNPIKALCWWLSYKLKRGVVTLLPCDMTRPEETTDTRALQQEMRKVTAQQQKVIAQLEVVQKENRTVTKRLDELLKSRDTDTQTPSDKEQQKPPKK
jgi:hypothetical protein